VLTGTFENAADLLHTKVILSGVPEDSNYWHAGCQLPRPTAVNETQGAVQKARKAQRIMISRPIASREVVSPMVSASRQ